MLNWRATRDQEDIFSGTWQAISYKVPAKPADQHRATNPSSKPRPSPGHSASPSPGSTPNSSPSESAGHSPGSNPSPNPHHSASPRPGSRQSPRPVMPQGPQGLLSAVLAPARGRPLQQWCPSKWGLLVLLELEHKRPAQPVGQRLPGRLLGTGRRYFWEPGNHGPPKAQPNRLTNAKPADHWDQEDLI